MNTSLLVTVFLALLVGSSTLATLYIPVSIGDEFTQREILESEQTFSRRKRYFAVITLALAAALISSVANADTWVTGGFAGVAALLLTAYITVLRAKYDM